MTGVIICGGTIYDYRYMKKYLQNADMIISVDSGARHCKAFGIKPDLLIGDYDSITSDDLKYYSKMGVEAIKYPAEKDMTDSDLAAEIAVKRGCSKLIFLGAIGTRLDHSISNIFMLKKLLDNGIDAMIADEHNEMIVIKDHYELKKEDDVFISLLPLAGKAEGVTISGFYYPLVDATLEVGSSWGVSNKFARDTASVTLKKGYLLVIKSRD
jgi:thiamine pyrophosphokinase